MSSIHECYAQSPTLGDIVGDARILDVENLSQFRTRLEQAGAEYSLNPQHPALSVPTPRCPDCRVTHYDRVMYLILERSRQTRTLQRFRVYLNGEKLVCIEDDFAYKNPYER